MVVATNPRVITLQREKIKKLYGTPEEGNPVPQVVPKAKFSKPRSK